MGPTYTIQEFIYVVTRSQPSQANFWLAGLKRFMAQSAWLCVAFGIAPSQLTALLHLPLQDMFLRKRVYDLEAMTGKPVRHLRAMLPFSTDEPPQRLTQQNKTVESATGGDKSLPQSSRGSSAILFYFCDWIHHDRLTWHDCKRDTLVWWVSRLDYSYTQM